MEEEQEYWDWTEERTQDDFKEWLLPHLMVGISEEVRESVRVSTDNWHKIKLQVSINGIPLPGSGERLLTRLWETYLQNVNRAAQELISYKFRDFVDLEEGLNKALKDAEHHIYSTLGIEPREE